MKNKYNSSRIFVNRDIRARKVRCINKDGDNIGVISTLDAIEMAEEDGLDLVMISKFSRDQDPTCKIVDYGKYKYNLDKKRKEQAKKRRESIIKLKEIKFKPSTDFNDLKTKARKTSKFLDEGWRVRIAIKFKGRELSHQEIGWDRLDEFVELIDNVDYFEQPQLNGSTLICVLARKVIKKS